MSKGYPFIDGHAKKISISVSSNIWNIIQNHPNRSGLINNILEREFLLHGNPEIDDRLKKIEKELFEIENSIKPDLDT